MNWIKENPFVAALAGITLVLAIVLIVIGMSGSSRYQEELANYTESSEQVARYQGGPLYPEPALRDSKRNFLNKYGEDISDLQEAFDPYRAEELETLTAQEFTDRLVAANAEVISAFEAAESILPEGFFLGFENYSAGTLARSGATGILNYQLGAVHELMMALAEAAPSELHNLHRPQLPEEGTGDTTWEREEGQVARELPLEVIFKGKESALRDFLTALASSEEHFYVIRTMRVTNEKVTPPLAADAKFEAIKDAPGAGAAAPAADPFGGFVFPGEEAPADDAADPAADPAAEAPEDAEVEAAEAPPAGGRVLTPGDTSRILGQVLGNEEINVFLRLDVLQFLAPLELPQP